MTRIFVYEAEPGDWRFDEDYQAYGSFVEVDQADLLELRLLNDARKQLNAKLENLKNNEIDEWP